MLSLTQVTEGGGYLDHTFPSYLCFVVQAGGENGQYDFGLTEADLGEMLLLQKIIASVLTALSLPCPGGGAEILYKCDLS